MDRPASRLSRDASGVPVGRGGGGIDWRHDQVGRLGGLAVEEKDRGANGSSHSALLRW